MKPTFDIRGSLVPYERITVNLEEFEEVFVNSFDPDSTRYELFQNYKNYLSDFQNEVTEDFVQWVNGSFVTNKPNPGDIDFVNLIPTDIYQSKEAIIDQKFKLRGGKTIYKVDAYTMEIFEEGHPKNWNYQADRIYWDNWFSFTKKNRAKKKFQKGYLEIRFGKFKNSAR